MSAPRTRAEAYEEGILEEPADFKPRVAPWIRTAAYATSVISGAAAYLATGVTAVLWPDYSQTVLAVSGVVTGTVALLAGAVGVIYRPTR